MAQIPCPGRMVGYRPMNIDDGDVQAALVTFVHGDGGPDAAVDLLALTRYGVQVRLNVEHDENEQQPGTWHWLMWPAGRDGQ
jgi:hypothetical protein